MPTIHSSSDSSQKRTNQHGSHAEQTEQAGEYYSSEALTSQSLRGKTPAHGRVHTTNGMFNPAYVVSSFRSRLLVLRNRHFLALDVLICLLTPLLALMLRTDGDDISGKYLRSLVVITPLFLLIKLVVFLRGGLYNRFWRYAGVEELGSIIWLGLIALLAETIFFFLVLRPLHLLSPDFPRSVPILDGFLSLGLIGALRFSVRMVDVAHHTRTRKSYSKPVLVAGAGSAGVMIVAEMRTNPNLGMTPIGFLDDAREKQGARIRGVPVLGRCSDIARVASDTNAQEVIIAMPTARGKEIRQIVTLCEQAGVHAKTIPGMYELLGGTVSVKQLRDVEIEDLLRRDPVRTDLAAVAELVRGKRVMVTGGGGSIGSEICRQVLHYEPSMLLVLGHGENSVFEIQSELERLLEQKHGAESEGRTIIVPIIADIRFPDRIQSLFQRYRPEVVFHAAAHKHVPLMEMNICEAVTNNVLGTRNLLESAQYVGVEHFVLISSDKAVNPTGVMGASKRVAELLVHQAAVLGGRHYVAVRFGNVLGSRGSVVLTFKQQIAAGGPVRVTHPEMARYFITIPEAVQLVMQASTLGKEGEVFMLDMGEPVKIVDLARDLIELSGFEVGRDIDIVFVGMRPGEKLYEELFVRGEVYKPTQHEKVHILGNSSNFVPANLDTAIKDMELAAERDDAEAILAAFKYLVPEFQPVGYTVEGKGRRLEPLRIFDMITPRVSHISEAISSPGTRAKHTSTQTTTTNSP